MLGSFPPKREKWSMEFFYPNWINDMWRIVGHVFYGDRNRFVAKDSSGKMLNKFDKEMIVGFCAMKGIALYDTASEVKRLKDNASDKFLEVVRPTDIAGLMELIPECSVVVTTGQKATEVMCDTFGCNEPKVGYHTEFMCGDRQCRLWRMPSSSRAYPMALERKAEFYKSMFLSEGLLTI